MSKKNSYSLLSKEMTKLEKSKKPARNQSKTSKNNDQRTEKKSNNKASVNEAQIEDPDVPDRSLGDFCCRLCDSHMNSSDMWQAHITGKKHLKNKLKGKNPETKYEDLDVESDLKFQLKNVKDPVVGLSYVHEMRRKDPTVPPFYNCFLCQANIATVPLVIEHILSLKHRQNYMKENDKEEYELLNSTKLPSQHLEPLLYEAAVKMEQKFGRGEVKVKQEKPKKWTPGKWVPVDGEKKPKKKNADPSVWKAVDDGKEKYSHQNKDIYILEDDNRSLGPRKSYKKRSDSRGREDFYSHSESEDLRMKLTRKRSRSPDYEPRKRSFSPMYGPPRSPSPMYGPQRSLSSMYKQRSPSPRPSHGLRSHSPGPSYGLKRRSPSPVHGQRKRSPSPVYRNKAKESYGPRTPPRESPQSYHTEDKLLPHEIVKSSAPSLTLEEFIQKVLDLPNEVFLKIVSYKVERMKDIRVSDLTNIINIGKKLQSLLEKHLQPLNSPQTSASVNSASSSVASVPQQNNPPKPPNLQTQQSSFTFINNFLESLKNSRNTSVPQNPSVSPSALSSPSTNAYSVLPGISQQHNVSSPSLYQNSSTQNMSTAQQKTVTQPTYQNLNMPYQNNSYFTAPRQASQVSVGNFSYNNTPERLPPQIPGLSLENDRRDQQNYQLNISPANTFPMQNYPHKY